MRHLLRWSFPCVVAVLFAVQAFAACDPIAIVNPPNGGTVQRTPDESVFLKWNDVPGATSYDVYFGTPGQACNSVPYATTTGSDFQPDSSDVQNGVSYEWKVVANGTGCPTAPTSGCKTFTVAPCPAAPTLTAPANGAEFGFGNVTLQWSAVSHTHDYQLYVGIDGGEPSLAATQLTTSKTFFVEPGRTIEWYVVARANGCDGSVSATRTFSTSCPTTPPAAGSPANGATFADGAPITFNWSTVPGSASYDVKVFNGVEWVIIGENLSGTTFTISSLPQGDYLWEVRANFNSSCTPLFSEPRELVVGPGCTGGEAPHLTSPANNATVNPPVTFQWSAVAEAQAYILRARKTSDTVARTLTTTQNLSYTTGGLEPGTYEWWVIADFDDCPNQESSRRTITIEGEGQCPANPGKAALVSPANGANNLSSPVTFQWGAVPGAKGYRVLAGFGNGELEVLGTTTATSLTVPLPAGSGAWAVQTFFDEDCPTTVSDRRTFTVTNGAPCGTVPPQLVSPAQGANVQTQQVTFTWAAITGATGYRLFVAVGDDDDFKFYGETTTTSLERFVPLGPVQWYVVATFAACPNLQSGPFSFLVTEPSCPPATPISLLEPANNSTVTSPTRFAWSGVQGASAYRVWVSTDGAAPVAVARTTATEATVSLPAGVMRWYVEAIRERCIPVVSSEATFTITPGANCGNNLPPALVSPVGPRTTPAPVTENVTLDWNAVEGAIGYRVWVGRNGDAYMDVALTRETEYTINDLDEGLYGWFVQALFEACNPVDSERSFFLVDPTEERCPNVPPTPLSPAQGSTPTSPVTFSWTGVDAEEYRVYVSRNGNEPQLIGTTGETELTRALPPGNYLWAVEAVPDDCPSVFSQRVGFTIAEGQNCSDTGATLVSPANGATDVVPPAEFVWSPVSGAVKYVLVARVNDGAPTPITVTEETRFEVEKLPPGRIEWWVVTYFASCDPAESEHFRFTVPQPACDNGRPILLIPAERVTSPVGFQWTAVRNATRYRVWLSVGDERPSVVASTVEQEAEVELPTGTYEWFVEAEFANCPSTRSARAEFSVTPPVACGALPKPDAQVVGQAVSNSSYRLRWDSLPNVDLYEVQEATSPNFADAKTFTTSRTFFRFEHEVTGAPVQFLYRVRGVSNCNDERSAYSDPVGVVITAPRTNNASAEIGAEANVVQTVFLAGSTDPYTFTATSDKPWITITPSSGVLPVEGITLTVTADAAVLPPGTNTGTIQVQYTLAAGAKPNPKEDALTSIALPISVSLITPVFPTGKATPPPDSLIFPVVGHAQGFNNSLFESDIRVTNLTAQTKKYELHFTPSGTNGTITGSSSTVEIGSGSTLALDDIVATLFGIGTTSGATGMLEVRPLETATSASGSLFSTVTEGLVKQLDTAASSRTYNFTPNGTFGQYIPATRFSDFVGLVPGAAAQILSMQQVAQSAAFRANFGFAEGSGEPANLMVRVYDVLGGLLATIPVNLQAGEHIQLNGMLANNGINDLEDGRVEVEVVGGNGKVTAYVSEVDNITNDPLLVSPVVKGAITSNRYVVPGTAFANTGFAFWVTDMRVFNAGAASTPATLTFYPMVNPAGAVSREIDIAAGEIKVLNNVIGDLFGQPNGAAGMVTITTPGDTQLTATARTYNMAAAGTYGQYIPGVTPAESVGAADRPLQLLQLESSSRFRTNIGLAETTGQPAMVEVSVTVPDIKFTPLITIPMAGNEFRQFSLDDFGLGAVYNARVQIRVIEGNGRVTAYGSAIDRITQDPTYVPAQ
jgi:hypothetical protein